jgi:two-component system LytT family sensor kinase
MGIPSKHFIGSKAIIVILHVAGCLLFVLSPLFLNPSQNRFPGQDALHFRMVLDNVLLALFFYLNLFFLLPRVLTNYGWPRYIIAVLIGFVVFGFLTYFMHDLMRPELEEWRNNFNQMRPRFGNPNGPPPDRNRFFSGRFFMHFPFLMAWALSTSIKFSLDYARIERERKESENENLKSELSLLRSQISPHFMFNVLNSLTALARKKSDDLEPIIIKLSQLMRYMLYDSGIDKVSLETEIEYLQNYIDLQKLRFGSAVTVRFEKNVTQNGFALEPMLLIPFVENAFKHGTGMIMHPEIVISLMNEKKHLNFIVRNRFTPNVKEEKDKTSGIGLQNVKRRLELLYPKKYSLDINHDKEWFEVKLKLEGE